MFHGFSQSLYEKGHSECSSCSRVTWTRLLCECKICAGLSLGSDLITPNKARLRVTYQRMGSDDESDDEGDGVRSLLIGGGKGGGLL